MVPLADTVKEVDESGAGNPARVRRTVPRDALRGAQTPQAFRCAELAERLAQARRRGERHTDEAGLYEASGAEVACVLGSRLNVKVTTDEDLALLEALMARETGTGRT